MADGLGGDAGALGAADVVVAPGLGRSRAAMAGAGRPVDEVGDEAVAEKPHGVPGVVFGGRRQVARLVQPPRRAGKAGTAAAQPAKRGGSRSRTTVRRRSTSRVRHRSHGAGGVGSEVNAGALPEYLTGTECLGRALTLF